MDTRGTTGGIIAALEILADYKAAFVYDFRHRFGLGIQDLGATIPWNEVIALMAVLLTDPTSWLQTARNGWSHPISYEWTVSAATYDLLAQVNSKRKPKPWPRPWPSGGEKKIGKRTRKDARAILARAKNGDLEWQNRHTPM